MTGQINDVVIIGDRVFAALYLAPYGSTEKAYMTFGNKELVGSIWISKRWCKILRKANDDEREVFEIPMHQAKYHLQLVGEENWVKSKNNKRNRHAKSD